MFRNLTFAFVVLAATWPVCLRADIVTDWNVTLNQAIIATPSKHNPGNPTRAMAMMNGAIYDVFQAINRTHAPLKFSPLTPGADLDAAVAQVAYRMIKDCYVEQMTMLDGVLASRLGPGPFSPAQLAGIQLGNDIAQHYITAHAGDGWDQPDSYTTTPGPGHWSEDPLNTPQKGWGKAWGTVTPWVMQNSAQFDSQYAVMGLPALSSQAYTNAYEQVRDYGARVSTVRDSVKTDQTAIGLFWAYDRPNLPLKPGNGPPPVLFIENMIDIAAQANNTKEENARLFALASVSMADAAIAAWHAKFDTDFWRPITAIRNGGLGGANDANGNSNADGNPNTIGDPNWAPLGAPGFDPNSSSDDFTPPFPAYTSGHATMGGAVFKALELFYGTNVWDEVDGIPGNDAQYTLHSKEAGGGNARDFERFTQSVPLTVGTENSPEGENAISRIYLGIHWIFDAVDGTHLGNMVADYAYENHFQAVPEPTAIALGMLATIAIGLMRRR